MFRPTSSLLAALALIATPALGEAEPQLRQPWDQAYSGDDATGKHVIALWSFDGDKPGEDRSGHGHDAALHGATIHKKGRFGSALESFRGHPVEDKRHAAVVADRADLSPQGAFTVEMWIQPKKTIEDYPSSFLLDKTYVSDHDYQLVLSGANRSGTRTLSMRLGFGKDSASFHARPYRFEIGEWVHVAFTYDGAGTGRFYVNGRAWGSTHHGDRKAISPGNKQLSIGDRLGSNYHGFPGLIDQVRLCKGVLEFRSVKVTARRERRVFVRKEQAPPLKLTVTNVRREPLADANLKVSADRIVLDEVNLPTIASGADHTVDAKLDTDLRPDAYTLLVEITGKGLSEGSVRETFPLRIVGRRPPHRFPVVMWGVYSASRVPDEIDRLKRIGFTHVLGFGADYQKIWQSGEPTGPHDPDGTRAVRDMLDEALASDLSIAATLSPGRFAQGKDDYLRVTRQGTPVKDKNVCGLFPEVIRFCRNVGVSVGREYGGHPAFDAALIHTEVRDHARPCFHDHDRQAYRDATGGDIPEQVTSRWGVPHSRIDDFPKDRIIADDHPILRYYRWYWKHGDGWNGLNTAVCEGLKAGGATAWTWFDPAVRVATTYGSGGKVDVLSQWTYSYPDPIRIAIATDELFAMAGGATPPQDVMKMTQIIWYRAQTAPMPKEADKTAPPPDRARWEIEQPDAPFVTIAPMHLREAFWTKIARPIHGIMYHGWQSLVPCPPGSSYRYTHPQTQHELTRLIDEVVEPLGPTLLQIPGVRSDVAFLESFASQVFARRGTFGWGKGWTGDAYLMALYARLQPEIVYDETITQRGLDGYRVLIMPHCDVLTRSVAEKIKAFQHRGGIVVADEHLAPAIKPDIRIKAVARTGKAKLDKQALVARAAELRTKLDPRYDRYVDTTDADMIPYRRRDKQTDYVFLVNDRREFGTYVGQHGKVMEIGLPTEATLSVKRPSGTVYDLVTGRRLGAKQEGRQLRLDLMLGPCDGRLLMITPEPIGEMRLTAPRRVRRGDSATCRVEILSTQGKPVEAVVPVEVRIRDPEGRQAEYSGFYGAKDGTLSIPFDVAPNDRHGTWQVDVRDLATGHEATAYVRVVAKES